MKFIHDDFLLNTESAKILYHDYAKEMSIYDYHCHLDPKEIAENRNFRNITEVWLAGDHYKWRAMRAMGIDEKYITGNASDKDKFQAWIKTVPYTMGNPLYHWTHLELARYFQYDNAVKEENWEELWELCNHKIESGSLKPKKILNDFKVRMVGTTDDPIDTLEYHEKIAADESIKTVVAPSFRPDKLLEIQKIGFTEYIESLGELEAIKVETIQDLIDTIEKRIHYFHENGCRIADHGFEYLPYRECTMKQAGEIFSKAISGGHVPTEEAEQYKTYLLKIMAAHYHKLGWAMQLHIGPVRNNNTRMFELLGPDSGFDSINDYQLAKPLNQFLNSMDMEQKLPRTIIYTLNPVHNEVIASTIGNFQSSEMKGKIQFGSGWWYNDQKEGMKKQMTDLANAGLLSLFVGMLTDSRSFLSYSRHEYFRRILSQLFGTWIEDGELPQDYEFIGRLIQDISYNNARDYFAIEVK